MAENKPNEETTPVEDVADVVEVVEVEGDATAQTPEPVAVTPAPKRAYRPSDPLAVAAMVLGIVSIPLMFAFGLGLATAIAGAICGHIALKRSKDEGAPESMRGQSLTGMICSYVAAGLAILGFFFVIIVACGSNGWHDFHHGGRVEVEMGRPGGMMMQEGQCGDGFCSGSSWKSDSGEAVQVMPGAPGRMQFGSNDSEGQPYTFKMPAGVDSADVTITDSEDGKQMMSWDLTIPGGLDSIGATENADGTITFKDGEGFGGAVCTLAEADHTMSKVQIHCTQDGADK